MNLSTDSSTDCGRLDRPGVLRELRSLKRKLSRVPLWYARRRELLHRGRELGIFHRELGDAAGISETAVIKEVQKPPG